MIVHLRRAPEALIPLDIFRNEVVGTATADDLLFDVRLHRLDRLSADLFSNSSSAVDSTAAGAGLIALVGGSVVGATIAGRDDAALRPLQARSAVGRRGVSAIAALALLSLFAASLNFWQPEALVLALGIGVGPLFPTATVSVQNAVDQRDLGVATATLAFLRTFGSAIGVALMGAVMIGFGVVTDAGVPPIGGGARPGPGQRAGRAFAAMFALQGAALAISLALLSADGGTPAARRGAKRRRARRMIAA